MNIYFDKTTCKFDNKAEFAKNLKNINPSYNFIDTFLQLENSCMRQYFSITDSHGMHSHLTIINNVEDEYLEIINDDSENFANYSQSPCYKNLFCVYIQDRSTQMDPYNVQYVYSRALDSEDGYFLMTTPNISHLFE